MKATFAGIDTPLKNSLPVTQTLAYGNNQTTTWQVDKFAREGVRINDLLYIMFSVWSENFPLAKLKCYSAENPTEELITHGANEIIARPNEDMAWTQLQRVNITYKLLSGTTYLHKRRDSTGRVRQFMPYSDANITGVPRGTQWINHYTWNDRDGAQVIIPKEDVICLPWFQVDPISPWKGLGPVLPTARQSDTDLELTKLVFSLCYNGAFPGMIVSLSGEEAIDADIDEIVSYIASNMTGENRGKTMAMKGNVSSTRIQNALSEIALSFPREITESRLCAAFRVPPIVAGVYTGIKSTRYAANSSALLLSFWTNSIMPLLDGEADILTHAMAGEFPGEQPFVYRYDYSRIDAIKERSWQEQQQAVGAYTAGVLQIDETRQSFPVPNDPPEPEKLISGGKGIVAEKENVNLANANVPPKKVQDNTNIVEESDDESIEGDENIQNVEG